MVKMSGGEALAKSLVREGVDVVFGIPGIQMYGIIAALRDEPGIRMITPRHEQATTYMADGYARASGKPGVALVVPGVGLYNAASGIATAYARSSPVLVIAGQIPQGLYRQESGRRSRDRGPAGHGAIRDQVAESCSYAQGYPLRGVRSVQTDAQWPLPSSPSRNPARGWGGTRRRSATKSGSCFQNCAEPRATSRGRPSHRPVQSTLDIRWRRCRPVRRRTGPR